MIVEHRFSIVARCPVNGVRDEYACTIRTDRTIGVEDILRNVELLTAKPIYQEDLTSELSNLLGAEVETIGVHSGVATTCRCK